MKARLIANGVLQLAVLIAFIGTFFASRSNVAQFTDAGMPIPNSNPTIDFEAVFTFLLLLAAVATTVMGIITLAMDKDDRVRGLTIASGILGIFSGVLGIGAIISFIAASKINENEINKEIDETSLISDTN